MKSRLLKKICIIHLQLEIALTRSWFIQNFSRNQSIKECQRWYRCRHNCTYMYTGPRNFNIKFTTIIFSILKSRYQQIKGMLTLNKLITK